MARLNHNRPRFHTPRKNFLEISFREKMFWNRIHFHDGPRIPKMQEIEWKTQERKALSLKKQLKKIVLSSQYQEDASEKTKEFILGTIKKLGSNLKEVLSYSDNKLNWIRRTIELYAKKT